MSGRLIAGEGIPTSTGDIALTQRRAGISRFGAALASPRGVLLSVPLLVALVGVTLTLVGQNALMDTSVSMARDRFVEQTSFASSRIAQALWQAEPVLDRMHVLAESADPEHPSDAIALALRDLIAGRPGMTQAYIAFPDGSFQGVYMESDGILRYQTSRVGPGASFHHYTFGPASLVWERDEPTDYDARKRAYFHVALEKRERAWTEPYPFFTTQRTGVTRVEPIFEHDTLRRVIAVDFDVSALSAFMARGERSDVRSLVFADGGVILAYPSAATRISHLRPTTHALTYQDIGDPLLDAFFAALPALRRAPAGELQRFRAEGDDILTSVTPVGDASGPRWHVAVLASEQSTLAALRLHRQRSLFIAAVALLGAVVFAWFFARNIVRARREVAVARAKAAEASRQARELGSYRLITCLGKGGMGEVWRAEHRLLARHAAIKLINAELTKGAATGEIQERFKREAQTIARLRSRNTVELFDYGVTNDGTFFYVMELLDGIDLETLTERYGPQPAARVVELLIQACNSLAEAHDAGLVHRDIKPANMFICRAADEVDVLKILDFGLVLAPAGTTDGEKSPVNGDASPPSTDAPTVPPSADGNLDPSTSARLTHQGSYLGTPTFIAPEQALGLEVDGRADIYALGCVAWWLLTGNLVFPASDPLACLMAHITQAAPPLGPLVGGALPPELEELIAACLRKDPRERPADARALAQVLRRIEFEPAERWTLEDAQAWWRKVTPSVAPPPVQALGAMDTVLSAASLEPRGG
jgi:serine/threonine protein kinase